MAGSGSGEAIGVEVHDTAGGVLFFVGRLLPFGATFGSSSLAWMAMRPADVVPESNVEPPPP